MKMNKKYLRTLFLACLLVLQGTLLKAQNIAINADGSTPDPSAMLDIKSDSLGLLIPRVVEALRPASPATGLLIYQTDGDAGFYYYNGSDWQKMAIVAGLGSIAHQDSNNVALTGGSINTTAIGSDSASSAKFTTLATGAQAGIGTSSPDNSAMFEVSSTTKGFLPPRMTTVEMHAIPNPATGLMIYNTDVMKPVFFDGNLWEAFDGQLRCGQTFTDARDSMVYTTVQIGGQCWMAENLAYLPAVSPPTSGSTSDPFYYVFDYNGSDLSAAKATENYQNYGALYNWPAATNDCPENWHLPSDAEWTVLTDYLGGEGVAGGKMKSTRTIPDPHPRWNSPNTGANNSSGFTVLPGGYRGVTGAFGYPGYNGYGWSSTESSSTDAWKRLLYSNYEYVRRLDSNKEAGFSVRCVRDL